MSAIKLVMLKSVEELENKVQSLLCARMRLETSTPYAIILPGGKTPRRIYEAIKNNAPKVSRSLRFIISDERYVPEDSPDSNFGIMREMTNALGIPEANVLRPRTDLPLKKAAVRYDGDLRGFTRLRGRFALGLLGLGADGHTAGLFSASDMLKGMGRYAIPVERPDGMQGVTVTRDLLLKSEQIVFITTGPEKGAAVEKLMRNPGSAVAGQAVEDIRNVELWYAPGGEILEYE